MSMDSNGGNVSGDNMTQVNPIMQGNGINMASSNVNVSAGLGNSTPNSVEQNQEPPLLIPQPAFVYWFQQYF